MRHCYTEDPTLIERVFPLLETAFPGIAAHARRVILPGGRWQENSTPFLIEQADQLVAHIGVLPICMTIAGRPTRVGGIHAVCTHPEHRRRGHFRGLMEETLHWCDREQRLSTLILFTGQPHLYIPFGFRPMQEHHFIAEVHTPAGASGFRSLDLAALSDLRLLDHHLTHRAPVSKLLGVTGERAIFAFHCPTRGLLYSEDLNAIIWASVEGATLKLTDIVAPQIPSLSAILARLPHRIGRVEFEFCPDQFGVEAAPVARPSELMVRGTFAADGRPFMVPPPARC